MLRSVPASTPEPLALRAGTLCEAFLRTAGERPGAVALRTPRDGVSITWEAYAERTARLAAGLAALGVERGDTVALMLLNRPEFHLLDTAALHLGAIPFSVYNTSAVEQVDEIFANAQPVVVVTERAFLPVVGPAARRCASLRQVVLIDGRQHRALALADVEERGAAGLDLREAARAVEPDDVATLLYTSGTSGPPKGVELTHRSILASSRAAQRRLELPPGGRLISYLPAAHIVDRWLSHYHGSLGLGCTVTCVADPRTLAVNLPDTRPTAWGGVPRVLEKLRAALIRKGFADPAALAEEQRAAIRRRLGFDSLTWLAAGAAPVPLDVLDFFGALGLPVVEMWGMCETAGPGLANPPRAIRNGTCGLPLDGLEVRLASDGELLVRGEPVMRGYRGEPGRTRRALTPDGWLRTGDVASMDEDGYIAIVDRKKDIIINTAGKNMAPANIERALSAADPLIGNAVVIGDRRPYNVALIVLDPEAAAWWAGQHGMAGATLAELARAPALQAAMRQAVAVANRRISRVEHVKGWTVLPLAWEPGGPELTPTLKPRRRAIAARYAEEIDALYAAAGEGPLDDL